MLVMQACREVWNLRHARNDASGRIWTHRSEAQRSVIRARIYDQSLKRQQHGSDSVSLLNSTATEEEEGKRDRKERESFASIELVIEQGSTKLKLCEHLGGKSLSVY